jgi:phosphopantothenoylcysteine decarboxylase / phosphopantothenate---cysteine ligase
MWENPLTQNNLGRLVATGRFSTVGPDVGALACGWVGAGRMMEAADIRDAVVARLANAGTLVGRHVVITAGPTYEPVDDVRFLGNRSSGKMGFALAGSAVAQGAKVTLIAGPVSLPTPGGNVTRINVQTALEMQAAVIEASASADVVVMTAAVADFRPAHPSAGKLSRRQSGVATLELTANPDILAGLGQMRKGARPYLVGFSAEIQATDEAMRLRATAKLGEKNCDAMVANNVGDSSIGFGSDENAGVLLFADGKAVPLEKSSKRRFADALWRELSPRFVKPAAPGQ